MFEFLGDLLTNNTASHLEYLKGRRQFRPTSIAKNPFDTTKEDIAELQRQNAELRLYVAVLTRLFLDKQLLSAEELRRRLAELDGSDGEADGGLSGPILPKSKP